MGRSCAADAARRRRFPKSGSFSSRFCAPDRCACPAACATRSRGPCSTSTCRRSTRSTTSRAIWRVTSAATAPDRAASAGASRLSAVGARGIGAPIDAPGTRRPPSSGVRCATPTSACTSISVGETTRCHRQSRRPATWTDLDGDRGVSGRGLVLIGAGELMHRRTGPVVVPTPAPIAAQSSAPDHRGAVQRSGYRRAVQRAGSPPPAAPERGVIAVRDEPSISASASRPEVRRIAVKRTRARRPTASRQSASRPASRGVLDRLRLGWLRNAFSPRHPALAHRLAPALRFGVSLSRVRSVPRSREGGCHII